MAIIDSSLAIVADTETNRNETSRTSQDTAVMLEPGDENQVQTQCQAGNHAEVDMEDAASESSGYEEPKDLAIQEDMERLQEAFPDFREKYRLIKRIGEGKSLRCPTQANEASTLALHPRNLLDRVQGPGPLLRRLRKLLGYQLRPPVRMGTPPTG